MINISKTDQIGIVVKNINETIEELEKLGFGSFSTLELSNLIVEYRGIERNIDMKLAFAHLGEIQLELIEAHGKCFYTDFIKVHGEGLNHLGIFVKNIDSEVKKYINAGFSILQEGNILGVRWVYLDTYSILGFVLELIEVP